MSPNALALSVEEISEKKKEEISKDILECWLFLRKSFILDPLQIQECEQMTTA